MVSKVGVGLHHAGRDRASARVRDRLHRHQGIRFTSFGSKISVQDPRSSRCRGAAAARSGRCRAARMQARDEVVDLVARQLAALAGFGALRDLDLRHFRR